MVLLMSQIPVFLINLDRSKQRLIDSTAQLDRLKVSFRRISAIDGSELNIADVAAFKDRDFAGYYKQLSLAEYACYLSHRKCWQVIQDESIEYAVILEDDCVLQSGFVECLQDLPSIPIDWECLKLTEFPIKRVVLKQLLYKTWQVCAYNKAPSRTGAYAISLSGAKKMLAHSTKILRPVDVDFQYVWEHGVDIYGLKPYPVNVERGTQSTIDTEANRKNARKSFPVKFVQGWAYLFRIKLYNKKRAEKLNSLGFR